MRKKIKTSCLILILISLWAIVDSHIARAQPQIITLRWKDVVRRSRRDNLGLKSTALDHHYQKLSTWQAIGDFLPSLSYHATATNNLELSEMILMGERIKTGTEYNYQHSLQLSYPLFTGFSRLANLRMQKSLEKSLQAQLKGQEDETVLSALQVYFRIVLSKELVQVNQEAVDAAQAHLEQVRQFYQVGAASELDLKRAEARYSSTLPSLESARNQFSTSQSQLKFLLNLPLNDSLTILDPLTSEQFIGQYADTSLNQLKTIALENRPELQQASHQSDAVNNQKTIALSQALPTVSLTADISQMAMTDRYRVSKEDYIRSKSINLIVEWPLFEGGQTALEYQKARAQVRQMEYAKRQIREQILMDVEQCSGDLNEARKKLGSLTASLDQAREALRLSNLMYQEGMSTQSEVLDAQLQYTQSNIAFQQGLYDSNISQLNLLKSIGKLDVLLQ